MAYSYTLGRQFRSEGMVAQEINVTGDGATGNIIPFPTNKEILGICVAPLSGTPQDLAWSYELSTGTIFFSGNVVGASSTKILVFMP